MRRIFSAVLMLSITLAGCRAKEAYDKARIAQDLDKHGTMDLMKDVSKDKYTPPADGKLTDAQDVVVGSTNASLFAYVADGKYGLRVYQLLSPEWTPGYAGFSPRPVPRLVATRHTHGPALAVSKGLDRDRAVDEGGNQVSIFNRIGARPMTLPEMQRLYLRDGSLYTVSETPTTKPVTR